MVLINKLIQLLEEYSILSCMFAKHHFHNPNLIKLSHDIKESLLKQPSFLYLSIENMN